MQYHGSCHCSQIRFTAEGDVAGAMACNCSMCQRKGILMWFIPRSALVLLTPDEDASTYTFGRKTIRHRFCATCGIHPFGEGTAPDGTPMASVNLRCLDDLDLAAVPVIQYDGRAL